LISRLAGADVRLVPAGFGIGFKQSWEQALREIEESGGRPRRVIGIDASAKPAETRDQVTRIARDTARLIGVERELGDEEIELDERYHAGTYGIPDDATLDAMRLAARTEGMITDPVYEGKSMAGLIDLIGRREIEPTATVLYAHLGGQPALNAYSALFS
jgi:1-aminocyclopropane-1-carboxylate deaminase